MPVKRERKENIALLLIRPSPFRVFYFIDLYARNKTTFGFHSLPFTARNTGRG
jgi:hypothetical protein